MSMTKMKHFLPDPADLRWLVRSLDLGSFSAAARELNVAVSVVTRAVDRLEAGYGLTLLRRSTHGLSPTPEGADLVTDGIDVALRTTVGNSDMVVARELGQFERRLYASPHYLRQHGEPANPHELHQHQIVTHTAQGLAVTWAFRKAGKRLDVTVRSQLAANTSALVHHALVAWAGIGMLSRPLAAADVASGRLVEVLAPFASRTAHTMFAVSLPSRRNAARVKAVIEFLQEAAQQRWALTTA
jgi:DNA-binding transcriptional LysR family regulator